MCGAASGITSIWLHLKFSISLWKRKLGNGPEAGCQFSATVLLQIKLSITLYIGMFGNDLREHGAEAFHTQPSDQQIQRNPYKKTKV